MLETDNAWKYLSFTSWLGIKHMISDWKLKVVGIQASENQWAWIKYLLAYKVYKYWSILFGYIL